MTFESSRNHQKSMVSNGKISDFDIDLTGLFWTKLYEKISLDDFRAGADLAVASVQRPHSV